MKLNFRFAICIIHTLGLISCNAQKADYNNSVLWEINKPEERHTSYILGTIHLMDTTQINFPVETLKDLIDSCKTLCVEILAGQVNEGKDINKYMYLSDDKLKISNCLEKEYYNALKQIADSSKYFLKRFEPYFDSIRPTILSFFIEADRQLMQSEKFNGFNYRPEIYFQEYAHKKEYEIIPLETVQQQIDWIVRLDLDPFFPIKHAIFPSPISRDTFLRTKNSVPLLNDFVIFFTEIAITSIIYLNFDEKGFLLKNIQYYLFVTCCYFHMNVFLGKCPKPHL